jgi:sigma-B regulation protein RsbU (phosphoserine phosphatase)
MRGSRRDRSKARLVVGPAANGRVVGLETLPFTIGRGAERNLTLSDPRVSREHAFIDCDAEGFFIRDMGSRHGTYVNGISIAAKNQSRLRTGDKIVLGAVSSADDTLVFEETEAETTTRTLLAKFSQVSGTNNELETLSLFLQAAQNLNSHGALNDVLRTVLEYTIRLTQAERGFVFMGPSFAEFKMALGRDSDGGTLIEHNAVSKTILRDAAESTEDFVLGDAMEESGKPGLESLLVHAIRSVAAIPLRGLNSGRLLGLLYLDSRRGKQDFRKSNREILHAIALQAATLLENLSMLEAEREASLLRKELEIAASIQRQIIPQTLPEFVGVQVSARTVPCTGVGGDFYDVIPLPDGFVAVVADVCGKGVPAALLASMVHGMLHAQITSGASVVDAVTQVSQFVCSRTGVEKYVTMVVLRYWASSSGGRVELVNGGHLSPVIVRANGAVETIKDGDMPVGMLSFATFHAVACALGPGDRVVLMSDGVSEAENAAGVQFGEAGMAGLAGVLRATDLVGAVFGGLTEFCAGVAPQDDQTVLMVEVG